MCNWIIGNFFLEFHIVHILVHNASTPSRWTFLFLLWLSTARYFVLKSLLPTPLVGVVVGASSAACARDASRDRQESPPTFFGCSAASFYASICHVMFRQPVGPARRIDNGTLSTCAMDGVPRHPAADLKVFRCYIHRIGVHFLDQVFIAIA